MANEYSKFLYVRTVNPGTRNQFQISGTTPSEVGHDAVGDKETVSPMVARYMLVGLGAIHHTAPLYVEEESVG